MHEVHELAASQGLYLGKAPPLRYYADVAVKLTDYIDFAVLPTPPKRLPQLSKGIKYGYFLNDRLGDCTCASFGHKFQIDTARTGQPQTPSDDAIMELYHQTGIEQNLSDNDGRYMIGVLDHMKRTGLKNPDGNYDKIVGYAAVNWLDPVMLKTACWLFGGVYSGMALPLDAYYQMQAGKAWGCTTGANAAAGSWGGHATFWTTPNTIVTWATLQNMTDCWRNKYGDESYAVLTEEWVENVKAPNGFSRDELIRDLQSIK